MRASGGGRRLLHCNRLETVHFSIAPGYDELSAVRTARHCLQCALHEQKIKRLFPGEFDFAVLT